MWVELEPSDHKKHIRNHSEFHENLDDKKKSNSEHRQRHKKRRNSDPPVVGTPVEDIRHQDSSRFQDLGRDGFSPMHARKSRYAADRAPSQGSHLSILDHLWMILDHLWMIRPDHHQRAILLLCVVSSPPGHVLKTEYVRHKAEPHSVPCMQERTSMLLITHRHKGVPFAAGIHHGHPLYGGHNKSPARRGHASS